MKKKFEKPSIEVIEFEATDIIATSNDLFSTGVNVGGVNVDDIKATPSVIPNSTQY